MMNHGLDNVAGDKDMKTFIEEIRLPDEKKILDYLEEVLNVSTITDLLSFHANQKKDRSLSKKMQFNLPLSPQVGGNLYALTQEILHLLNYTDHPVAFYISNDSGLNASSFFNSNDDEPHYIVFNSGLLEKLRWTHLSRQFFRKVKLHPGAVFMFFCMCSYPLSRGLSTANFRPLPFSGAGWAGLGCG